MNDFLLIKYYYTVVTEAPLLSNMQIIIERLLESTFKDVDIFFHFIDATSSSYYNDFIEVEYSILLNENDKELIFNSIKENIFFLIEDDDNNKNYLQFAIFRKIEKLDYVRNDFDE